MEEKGLSLETVATRMGVSDRWAECLVKGEHRITPSIALSLECIFGIDAEFWIRRDNLYFEKLNNLKERQKQL